MNAIRPLIVDEMPVEREMPERVSTRRLADIDRAKGLAILLVVLGHIAREAPRGQEWYQVLKDALYQFHMPFFMSLCGVTMYLSYKPFRGADGYWRYLRGKFLRLMPAFLLFGLLVLVGKSFAARFLPVDNLPESFWSGAWLILTRPITSSAGFLWFIYTLFLFYAALPALMPLARRHFAWLLLLAATLHFLPLDKSLADWFMLGQFAEYLLFIVVGFAVARHYEEWTAFLDEYATGLIALFAALVAVFLAIGPVPLTSKTVLGLASIPALHALVRLPFSARQRWLATLGSYSFTIYLLNLFVIGLVKGVTAVSLRQATEWFPIVALGMLVLGCLAPIALSRVLFQRFPWLDRVTR